MGVGGKFWDLLKPYARYEGHDFLRNKRVAVDLSYWIVQHETAIKSFVRKPHLRLTFYRTINLFSKFGAFPVFVYDGTPSPLKSRARIARYYRFSGVEASNVPVAEEGVSVERNGVFERMVKDCVELLQLFGMPVLKADGEAEALCAQLNSEGFVDACITADSDAFVFGANCVIKSFKPNSEEPFECYQMSDIEAGLGLKRNHLLAISLLVGNDHDLNGVQGIGVNTALRFVQTFSEEEILNSLREIGRGKLHMFEGVSKVPENLVIDLDSSPKLKVSHCSFCGHPGLKRIHYKFCCEYCGSGIGEGCTKKPEGFKCDCHSCNEERKEKEQQKHENWQLKVCNKISMEPNFPNEKIIELYTCDSLRKLTEDYSARLSWESPNTDMVVDFLVFHQLWEPSYVRQMMIPMLSTIYLRETAASQENGLLYGQYEFYSIQRIKIRYGHKCYVIKWKKAAHTVSSNTCARALEESNSQDEEIVEVDESIDELEENNVLKSFIEDGCWFLLTDENMDLVRSAFPDAVNRFLHEKELKESKRKKSSSSGGKPESAKPNGIQRSITEFYRSTKGLLHATEEEDLAKKIDSQDDSTSKEKRKLSSSNIQKPLGFPFQVDGLAYCAGNVHGQRQKDLQYTKRLGNHHPVLILPSPSLAHLILVLINLNMNSEEAFLVGNGAIGGPESAAIGVTVLAVDCDPACLAIVSKMLYASGYRVITAMNAAEAMSILREKEDELDLILTEIHLPDMDKYELLERMREISNTPIVILSADDDENAMLECLFKGATFYLLKPISMNEMRNLWQFAKIKKHEESEDSEKSTICQGDSPPHNLSNEELDSTSFSSSLEQNAKKRTRRELEEEGDDEVDIDYSASPKKPKLNWTGEMHLKFVQAIRALGIDAHPRKILKHVNVPGLKKESISSHLQEYRLYLKREQDAMERTVADTPPFNFHDKTFDFLKPQLSMTRNPEFYVQNQNNLSQSIDSLGSTNLPMFVGSKNNNSSSHGQYDEDHSTCSSESTGMKSCSNEDLGIFDQSAANFRLEDAIASELPGDFSRKQQEFAVPPLSPPVWEQQSNDMFDAAMGDFEHLFGGTDFFF